MKFKLFSLAAITAFILSACGVNTLFCKVKRPTP